MASKRKTGLGTHAFFDSPDTDQAPSRKSSSPRMESARAKKGKKVRTTVMLYPHTMASLEQLKIDERRRGVRATYSDILEQAIEALLEKREEN